MSTDYSDITIGDALQSPNERRLAHILLNMLTDPQHAGSLHLVRGAMGRSNIAELSAVLDALKITDRLGLADIQPPTSSLDNTRKGTEFTPFRATEADFDNLDTIKAHLSVAYTSDAIRAALMLYSVLIRAGIFDPADLEGE